MPAALAVARADEITLSHRFFQQTHAKQEWILAHEFAHIAQKRLAGTPALATAQNPAYEALVEMEATHAAEAALSGHLAICRVPDHPAVARAWGPAGHYFTCLFVMLAATGNEDAARRRAFFCQMPDQVFDFDAVSAEADNVQNESPSTFKIPFVSEFVPATPPQEIKYEMKKRMVSDGLGRAWVTEIVESDASKSRRKQIDRQISTGLHCLTGRSGDFEVEFRKQLLMKVANDDLKFGLALHAYGDSYAHQKDGKMYKPMIGHAFDGHTPDNVAAHATQYIHYVAELYRVVRANMPILAQRLDFVGMLDALEPVWKMKFEDEDDDEIQRRHCAKIIAIAKQKGVGDLRGYHPEYAKEVYWSQFWPKFPEYITPAGGPEHVYRTVRACGAGWGM